MFESVASPEMLKLAKTLSSTEAFSGFYLAGGTALAFQLGHRKSIDLDFFSESDFDPESLVRHLPGPQCDTQLNRGTIHTVIDGIKVSYLFYPYPLLTATLSFNEIRLASIADIACMKIVAISQRGDKKDFFDLYEILKNISIEELKKSFLHKYMNVGYNCHHILKSLLYFDDADGQPEPISMNKTDWDTVKKFFLASRERLYEAYICS